MSLFLYSSDFGLVSEKLCNGIIGNVNVAYGNRIHTAEKPDYLGEFTRIIKETFDRGGNVVIPSFAVGRTQEMLYFIREIKEKHLLPEYEDFDVYLDSPLAIEATKVFTMNMRDCFDKEAMELVNAEIGRAHV